MYWVDGFDTLGETVISGPAMTWLSSCGFGILTLSLTGVDSMEIFITYEVS